MQPGHQAHPAEANACDMHTATQTVGTTTAAAQLGTTSELHDAAQLGHPASANACSMGSATQTTGTVKTNAPDSRDATGIEPCAVAYAATQPDDTPPQVTATNHDLHMPSPQLQTTSQKTGIEPSDSGAATYVGGAPLPREPTVKPTPDVIHQQREAEVLQKALFNKYHAQELRDEKRNAKLTEKVRSAAHMAQAQLAATVAEKHHKADEKQALKVREENAKRFEAMFPGERDEVLAVFKCKYIDGKSVTSKGFLMVTGMNVRFAEEGGGSGVRETIPYKSVVSVETVGKPAFINLYTVERKVYRFTDISMSHKSGMEDESPESAAMNWIDHMWREMAQVPNPAATYYSA